MVPRERSSRPTRRSYSVRHHGAEGPRGDRRTGAWCRSATTAARPPGCGTPMSRWRATSRPRPSASSTSTRTGRTASATGTRSTPTCSTPTVVAAHGRAASPTPGRPTTRTSGCQRTIDGRRRRRRAVVLGRPRHRAGLGLRVPRGASPSARTSGRRFPTTGGITQRRTPGIGVRRAGWTLHPFLDALPDRGRRRDCAPTATPASGGRRPARATAGSSGRSTCRRTRAATVEVSITYVSDYVVPVRRGRRRRHRRVDRRRRIDVVRRRR